MVFTFSAPSIAQETPIDKMFSVMVMDKQVKGGFEAMLPMIDQMVNKFKLNQEGKEEFKGIFRTWLDEDIDRLKMMDEMKKLYSESFTVDEIREITKFYQTPVGKKFLQKSTKSMKYGAQIGIQEAQFKLTERIKPFLEKYDIK